MKRPRSTKYIDSDHAAATAASVGGDGPASIVADGPMPRMRESRYLRSRRTGASSPSFRKRALAGSCIVAVFASVVGAAASFPLLPAMDAASTTTARGVAPAGATTTDFDAARIVDWEDSDGLFLQRRLEEVEASGEKDSSSQQSEMKSDIEECTEPAGRCELCNFSQQKSEDACHETGRWQKFECLMPGDSKSTGIEDELSESTFKMKSCKRTDHEEGYRMFELQIFCLLIGSLSIMSVRKQKRLTSSLFDRRKQQGANAVKATSSAGSRKRATVGTVEEDNEIEFTPMTNQEREMVSLVERMEII